MESKITKKQALGRQVLLCCRNRLYALYPYLDGAFASLPFAEQDTKTIGTDGEKLYFDPAFTVESFGSEPGELYRGYLHILLHCLYLHPFRRRGRDRFLWNTACDMAVEQVIETEGSLPVKAADVKTQCLQNLGHRPLSAEKIYDMLSRGQFPYRPEQIGAAFLFDDHNLWEPAKPQTEEKWQHILSYTAGGSRQIGKNAGKHPGGETEKIDGLAGGQYDYRKYLRRFSVPREEMELDMDSFDYIYYHLGMEYYGNLPLIEPLEYREGHRLEQLVIAIDTSGSCSRETVRGFLRETYSILSQRENFFRKMDVYLIQCDCLVQNVAIIHSEEEWKNYSRDITIAGRGGTDFTPVFTYVQEKRQQGRLRNLKALLYFTDGDGCYPTVRPDYETAFVFLKQNEHMEAVPQWAKVLLVENGENL